MKFRKSGFLGVPNGEIYPREFAKGEECPPELEAAAIEVGAVRPPKAEPEGGGDSDGVADDGEADPGAGGGAGDGVTGS